MLACAAPPSHSRPRTTARRSPWTVHLGRSSARNRSAARTTARTPPTVPRRSEAALALSEDESETRIALQNLAAVYHCKGDTATAAELDARVSSLQENRGREWSSAAEREAKRKHEASELSGELSPSTNASGELQEWGRASVPEQRPRRRKAGPTNHQQQQQRGGAFGADMSKPDEVAKASLAAAKATAELLAAEEVRPSDDVAHIRISPRHN